MSVAADSGSMPAQKGPEIAPLVGVGRRYSACVGLLTDYFIAVSDAEAIKTADRPNGPRAPNVPTVQLKGVDPVVNLATLEALLTGQDVSVILSDSTRLIQDGGKGGPWVARVRPSLTEALATATPGQLDSASQRWAETEELTGSDPDDLRWVLSELQPLAARAKRDGKGLFCWMSL